MVSSEKIKVGQVGVANFGGYRRETMGESGLFDLVAAYDLNSAALAACEAEDGARPVGSYDDGGEFLHDLHEDPYEMRNLATEKPDLAAGCKAQLLELLRETREPFFDVIIEHGVAPEKTNHIRDDAAQIANMRRLGGLDLKSGPLPMA